MSDNPYSPFSNGTHFLDWQSCNCERCEKYNPEAEDLADGCDLEWILSIGGETADGSVSEETARRCGYLKDNGSTEDRYVWPCAIVEWTQEWKDEVLARRAQRELKAQQ